MCKGTMMCIAIAVSSSATAAWYDELKPSADLRYRFEYIDEEGRPSQQRDRIRARVGVSAPVNEEVTLGLRLTTAEQVNGEGDPLSGNKTLSNFGTKKGFFLDLAYFDWTPSAVRGLNLIAGKMNNPFICVGDYLWDHDYTPEGIAMRGNFGSDWKVLANAAYHWLQERSSDDDSMMLGGQLAFVAPISDSASLTLGGSVYGFTEMEGRQVFDWKRQNSAYGNSTRTFVKENQTNQLYATGFTTTEGFASIQLDLGLPVTLFGSAAINAEADDNNTGWMAGGKIGRLSKPGSVQIAYDYRRLHSDVMPGAFTDSDSFGGGTDAQGHKFQIAVQAMKNLQASVTYFLSEKRLKDPHDYHRLQVDFMAKF